MNRPWSRAEAKYAMGLGKWILGQRNKLELGRERFARMIGVHRHTLQRWEQGESMPNPYRLRQIQRVVKDAAVQS